MKDLFLDDESALRTILLVPNNRGTDVVQTTVGGRHLCAAKILFPLLPRRLWSSPNSQGIFPLHVAVERGWREGAEFLLDALGPGGALARDDNGAAPLHVAAFIGDVGCVQALLLAGVDVEIRDGEGRTALWLAKLKGFYEVARLLTDAGARNDLDGMAEEIEERSRRREEGKNKKAIA